MDWRQAKVVRVAAWSVLGLCALLLFLIALELVIPVALLGGLGYLAYRVLRRRG